MILWLPDIREQVTDARATMALFRLYKMKWESGFRPSHTFGLPKLKCEADDSSSGKVVTAKFQPTVAVLAFFPNAGQETRPFRSVQAR